MPAMRRPELFALALLMSMSFSAGCNNARERGAGEPAAAAGPPEPGVPLTLAQDRGARLSDVRYHLHFIVPDGVDAPVTGALTLRFRLTDASRPLAIDFAGPPASIRDARAQGAPVALTTGNEHLLVPASALRQGDNEIALSFESSDLALNRNRDFLYTLFVPARARLAFPCFDQPDVKARYTLGLEVPRGWEVLANGSEVSRETQAERVKVAFAETRPLPTYLLAFAAGRFSVETAERNGRQFRMLHRETDAQKVARNRTEVFDLHARALAWLERYTGIPYPFEKFDFLLVPSFQFGGMEHPGAIFYNASAVLLDPSATQNQKLGRASLVAHETAHMWFGDLVTMRWFDDVWMKEVFANFMAAKIVNPSFPAINHELRFLYAHYPAAYDVDRTRGTNAIRQQLDNLNEAGSLYGAIIYQKAPIVMRQLELVVTENGLRDGLREYLNAHSYGNASWPDLIALLDRRTDEDLAAWSHAWVEEAGRPIVTTSEVRAARTGLALTFRQSDPVTGRGLTWSQRAQLAIGYRKRLYTLPARVTGRESAIHAGHLGPMGTPLFVLPAGGGVAYGDFVLDHKSRGYLSRHLHEIADPLTRGAALVTLWEEMLGGRVTPQAMFAAIVAALPHETDELTVQRLLSYAGHAFWTFLPPDERDAGAPGLERVLRAGMDGAKTPSLKAAWFNGLRDMARTPGTVGWLERVWRKTETVPGLTLAEPDYMTLALELAVREVNDWEHVLDEQLSRIRNPDRRAQFDFVRPALSADSAVRDAFFTSLQDAANRRREAWVLQAAGYLHHPLRAAESEKYIPASLELLREIQRTGDIFFPKRWMDATLGGHRSPSAAHMVNVFLENVPKEYPDRLKRIVLSSADDLFRASRLPER